MKEIYFIFLETKLKYNCQVLLDNYSPLSIIIPIIKNSWHTDKLDILNKYSNFILKPKNIFDLNNKNIPDNLDECFFYMNKYLLNIKKNIYLFYSGGVDSTAMVCSFLKNKQTDNIYIIYSDSSIKEYPLFFEKFIKNNFKYIKFEEYKKYNNIENNINVFGCEPDRYYSNKTICLVKELEFLNNKKWQDALYYIYSNYETIMKVYNKYKYNIINYNFILDKIDYYINIYENYLDNIGIDKNCKWYKFLQIIMLFCLSETLPNIVINKSISYYDEKNFFGYYYFNRFKNDLYEIPSTINYKNDLKKYIFEYTNDDIYFKNKNDETSMLNGNIRKLGDPSLHIHFYDDTFINYTFNFKNNVVNEIIFINNKIKKYKIK